MGPELTHPTPTGLTQQQGARSQLSGTPVQTVSSGTRLAVSLGSPPWEHLEVGLHHHAIWRRFSGTCLQRVRGALSGGAPTALCCPSARLQRPGAVRSSSQGGHHGEGVSEQRGLATAAVISMSLLTINTSIQLIQSRLNNSHIRTPSVEGVVEVCQACFQARASPNTVSLCVNTLIPSCAQNQASILINLLRV